MRLFEGGYMQGRKYRDVNQWVIATIVIVSIITGCAGNQNLKKKQSEITRNIGEAYLAEGNYTSALRELLKAEQIYADDPLLQNYLGLAYQAKKLYQDAVTHYKKAIDMQPDYAPAYNNLGATYLEMNQWDAAIDIFKQLSENILYSTPQYAHLNLGWAYYNKGDYSAAEVYYKKAAKHYQDGFAKDLVYVKALRGLGKTHLALGDLDSAIEQLEEAVTLAPEFPPLLMDVADLRRTLGKRQAAIAAYRKVIEVVPGSDFAHKAKKALSILSPAE